VRDTCWTGRKRLSTVLQVTGIFVGWASLKVQLASLRMSANLFEPFPILLSKQVGRTPCLCGIVERWGGLAIVPGGLDNVDNALGVQRGALDLLV
jgi:hypothetical protein